MLGGEAQFCFFLFVGLKGCAGDACALVAPAWVQGYQPEGGLLRAVGEVGFGLPFHSIVGKEGFEGFEGGAVCGSHGLFSKVEVMKQFASKSEYFGVFAIACLVDCKL